jgi:hypothetical protein
MERGHPARNERLGVRFAFDHHPTLDTLFETGFNVRVALALFIR